MKKHIYNIMLLFLCCAAYFQCKKKDPDPVPVPMVVTDTLPKLKIRIQTDINGNRLALNTGKYLNANNDSFKISILKYYISNITLKNSNVSVYKVPNSYYLMDASISTDTTIIISNIPAGTYSEIGFSLGVDSIHNHSGSQPAALNPGIAGDMFWLWAPGYKFLELEGYYGPAETATMLFDISGDNNYKKYLLNSGTANWTNIITKNNAGTTVSLKANIDEMFKTPVTIKFDSTHNVSGGADAQTISDNYADMFGLSGIINP
jgi:hypothetical protein